MLECWNVGICKCLVPAYEATFIRKQFYMRNVIHFTLFSGTAENLDHVEAKTSLPGIFPSPGVAGPQQIRLLPSIDAAQSLLVRRVPGVLLYFHKHHRIIAPVKSDDVYVQTPILFNRMRIALHYLITGTAQELDCDILAPLTVPDRNIFSVTPLHERFPFSWRSERHLRSSEHQSRSRSWNRLWIPSTPMPPRV